jgi:hypothetical protein
LLCLVQLNGNRLVLCVVGEGCLAEFSSNSTLFVSSEWKLVVEHVIAVHPDCAGLESVGNAEGGVEVLGVDSGSETVSGVVGEVKDLSLVLELGNSADGAENLLLHDLHVGADVGEDGGLDEVTLVTETLTTDLDGGTLVLAGLDVAHDAVVLELRDLRTLEGLLVEWVTNLVLLSSLLEGSEELVVDGLLDEDTGTSTAALAVVVVDTEVDPVNGLLDVGVLEDDVGGLATKLEGDLLEVGGSSSLHDLSANDGGTSEGDLVNVHMRGESGTGSLAVTGDKVEDTGRETSLLDELSEDESGERSLLSSLHDDSVTSGQSRSDLPCQHEKGEVPRDNLTADTDRLGSGVVEHIGSNINCLALDLVGPTTVVSEAANNGTDIATGVGDGLSVVERLNSGEEVEVLLGEVGKLEEEVASGLGSSLPPLAVEGLAGSSDSQVDILLGTLTDGGDDLLSGGVDNLELSLVDTLNPLAVDEAGICVSISERFLIRLLRVVAYRPMGCW